MTEYTKRFLAFLICSMLLYIGGPNAAYAWSFSVEGVIIDDDGVPDDIEQTDFSYLYSDFFNDNSFSGSYINVKGNPVESSVGSLTGGAVTFDAYQGEIHTSTLTGTEHWHSSARIDTPMGGAGSLNSANAFSYIGAFGLSTPDSRGRYGIRLTDAGSAARDDMVEVALRHTQSGNLRVGFRYADYSAGTQQVIDQVALNIPVGADLIAMALIKSDAGSNAITAGFGFLDVDLLGNVTLIGTPTYFSGLHNIFTGEDWTRAEFFGIQAVPVPAAVWLFGSGLLGLFGVVRRLRS